MAKCYKCSASVPSSARLCPQCGHIMGVGGPAGNANQGASWGGPGENANQVVRSHLKALNVASFAFAIPGMLMQLAGLIMAEPDGPIKGDPAIALGLKIGGSVLLMIGLGIYAEMKGRSFAWGILGLGNIIGIIILGILAKVCTCGKISSYKATMCTKCSSPI